MKHEEIQKTIEMKFEDWIASIKDLRVKQLVRENCIITGGCIASMVLDEKINDFDVYMRTEESALLLARYYCDTVPLPCWPKVLSDRIQIKLPNGNPIKKKRPVKGYNVAYISPLAITLTDQIQITVRFFGTPGEIHKNYDFIHCTCYWTSWDKKLLLPKKAIESINKKRLLYVGSKYPIASIVRVKKFVSRGWKVSANQMLKMSIQISDLDLKDKEQLKEQLVGMYSKDLTKVVEDTKVDENGKVDRDSLFEAIDKHLKE